MINTSLKEIAFVILGLFLYMILLVSLVIPLDIFFDFQPNVTGSILGIVWQLSVIVIIFFYSLKKKFPKGFFGFKLPSSWKHYFIAWLGAYIIFITYALLINFLEYVGLDGIASLKKLQELPFSNDDNGYFLFFMAISVSIVAPIVEEILFRGYLLQSLLSHFSEQKSSLISGFCFSIFHLQIAVVIPFMLVGWLFAFTRIKSGSLLPSVFAHASVNTISMVYFFVS